MAGVEKLDGEIGGFDASGEAGDGGDGGERAAPFVEWDGGTLVDAHERNAESGNGDAIGESGHRDEFGRNELIEGGLGRVVREGGGDVDGARTKWGVDGAPGVLRSIGQGDELKGGGVDRVVVRAGIGVGFGCSKAELECAGEEADGGLRVSVAEFVADEEGKLGGGL